jgi:hypothetical protein
MLARKKASEKFKLNEENKNVSWMTMTTISFHPYERVNKINLSGVERQIECMQKTINLNRKGEKWMKII